MEMLLAVESRALEVSWKKSLINHLQLTLKYSQLSSFERQRLLGTTVFDWCGRI